MVETRSFGPLLTMRSLAPLHRRRHPEEVRSAVPKDGPLVVGGPRSTSGGPATRGTLEDLAASSRILADQGVFDAAGHVSMRHPGHAERFLMSRSLAPQMITADDIMEFDLDCNAID